MSPVSGQSAEKDGGRDALIIAAERLIGEFGLEGASFRQISLAAGSGNHFAVQYHFKNKAGLVQAVFGHRLPELEQRRAAMLTLATANGRLDDARALIEIIFRPLSDIKDRQGRRSYARFLANLPRSGPTILARTEADHLAPVTSHVMAVLIDVLRDIPAELVRRRMGYAAMLFLVELINVEEQRENGVVDAIIENALIEDALNTATAAVMTSVPPSVRAALAQMRSA